MIKIWRFCPHDESCVRQLSRELDISALLAQVLIARGYNSGQPAAEFLNAKLVDLHQPDLLPGIPEAVDRIVAAIHAGRRITIYGDYDVDGVAAISLLWHCLKLANATVDYYIPHRLEEGYGLNCDAIRQLHEEDPGRLVITVDCGIANLQEAILAKELGLELIVTDHHQISCDLSESQQLPEAACLVHPRLAGTDYPFGELCGAGVAFKLAWGICQRLGGGRKTSPQMREFLKSSVGLAAMATIADVVPLVDENRVLVRYGLNSLSERRSPGLQALMKVTGIEKNRRLQTEDIGYALAPRINAAGRLGQARLAVELLTTDNQDRAEALAGYLDKLNKNRQTVERRIFKQAKELVAKNPLWGDQAALVLQHSEWHAGVIGIVASRVAEHFEKPAVLISLSQQNDISQGSGRSFAKFDLHAGLSACAEHLCSFGGHRAAAGLKIEGTRIAAFREAFCRYAVKHHSTGTREELRIDAEVRLADLTRRAVNELERLGPFGQDNPRPVFAASKVELAEPPRKMGEGERHLALKVRHYGSVMRAIAFGRGEWADQIASVDGPISISFHPNINSYRGRESIELRLIDWKAETSVAVPVDQRSGIG